MKQNILRFLSGALSALLVIVLCVPAFAVVDPEPTDSRGDFYDWVVNNGGSFDAGRDGSIGGGRYSKVHYDDFLSEFPDVYLYSREVTPGLLAVFFLAEKNMIFPFESARSKPPCVSDAKNPAGA